MILMELKMQHIAAAGVVVRSDGLLSRTVVAGCAVWFYFWKFLCPVNLIFCYPRWSISQYDPLAYLPGVALAAVLAFAWWRRKTWGRPVVMTIVCYVILLLPVLGFVNIYFMEYSLVADHWQYAATIVLAAALGGLLAAIPRRFPELSGGEWPLCLGLLTVLFALTFQQSRMYADYETLFRVTTERNPGCWMAHNNLGMFLASAGNSDEAIREFKKAIAADAQNAYAYNNLGMTYLSTGKSLDAIDCYRAALRIQGEYPEGHNNLGVALLEIGKKEEALEEFRAAVRLKPDYPEARRNVDGVERELKQGNAK